MKGPWEIDEKKTYVGEPDDYESADVEHALDKNTFLVSSGGGGAGPSRYTHLLSPDGPKYHPHAGDNGKKGQHHGYN